VAGEPVLVVDDTPANQKLLKILLAGEHYDVRGAGNAEEALAVLERSASAPRPATPSASSRPGATAISPSQSTSTTSCRRSRVI
jgi:CheY-like chemotaxis protein